MSITRCSALVALAIATGLPAATHARPPERNPLSRIAAEATRQGEKLLRQDDARRAGVLPSGAFDPEAAPRVTISTRSGERQVTLQPFRHTVSGIGLSIVAASDRENLLRVYARLHQILPSKYLAGLPLPGQLASSPLSTVRRAYFNLANGIALTIDDILLDLPPAVLETLTLNPIGDCDLETGREAAGFDSELPDRCTLGGYSPSGLMANVDFPLKDDLTCVKDQGERGTCVAHSVVATVESLALQRSGIAYNLSEQSAFFAQSVQGDIAFGVGTMLIDGLDPLAVYVHSPLAFGVPLYLESEWNYNRSLARDDPELNPTTLLLEYPSSCGAYSGEMCADFSYQGVTTAPLPGVPVPQGPAMPATGTWLIRDVGTLPGGSGIVVDTSLAVVIVLLAGDVPVIAHITTDQEFNDYTGSDGYVEYDPASPLEGGHAVELVGFVPNELLPPDAPVAAGDGWFVAKNSWGTDAGDCGFYYIDHEFMRNRAVEFTVLSLQ